MKVKKNNFMQSEVSETEQRKRKRLANNKEVAPYTINHK